MVAGHELVQVGPRQRVLLEREILVGAQVVDPQLVGCRLLAARPLVEEQHVGLHPLGVEHPRGQPQQRVHIALVQQLAPHRLARAAFEQHIIRHHHRRPAVHRQYRPHVLDEIELLVAGRGPEIVAHDHLALAPRLALLVHERHAALLPERRVGHHQPEALARVGRQAVAHVDWARPAVGANAVQIQVHHAQPGRVVHDLPAVQRPVPQVVPLVAVQRAVVLWVRDVIVRRQQEPARAAGRVGHRVRRPRPHHVHNRLDQRPRREVLPRPALGVLGVLLQQPLVNLTLHVDVQAGPRLAVDQLDQPLQLRRVLDLVLRLAEDHRDEPRALPQRGQDCAVMALQRLPIQPHQALPVAHRRRWRSPAPPPAPRRPSSGTAGT